MSADTTYSFKGDEFVNRYRIMGTLTTQSPLHIGSGEREPERSVPDPQRDDNGDEEIPLVDQVMRDFNGRPYIPGSSLRGVVRHYLLQVFQNHNHAIAKHVDYETQAFRDMDQEQTKAYVRGASLLERVFGTPFSESKVEFWDSPLSNPVSTTGLQNKSWNPERQTYVVRSVAIDPATGAAEENKLYSFEVVPAGARFDINITGQNLDEVELGFMLFGLYGFSSEILPLTLGAMSARGFGRATFGITSINVLDKNNLQVWVKKALENDHAGYFLFDKLPPADTKTKIDGFKQAFLQTIS